MDVSIPEKSSLQIAKLIEAEQWVITGTFKKTVISRAFLATAGRADRTVHIKNNPILQPPLVKFVYPYARQIHQELQILRLSQYLCLESAHYTGSRTMIRLIIFIIILHSIEKCRIFQSESTMCPIIAFLSYISFMFE